MDKSDIWVKSGTEEKQNRHMNNEGTMRLGLAGHRHDSRLFSTRSKRHGVRGPSLTRRMTAGALFAGRQATDDTQTPVSCWPLSLLRGPALKFEVAPQKRDLIAELASVVGFLSQLLAKGVSGGFGC